jgi:hypothetical protein
MHVFRIVLLEPNALFFGTIHRTYRNPCRENVRGMNYIRMEKMKRMNKALEADADEVRRR